MKNLGLPSLSSISELRSLSHECKTTGRIIGLCHGCFDITHWGHMLHFHAAKNEVDVLVVSISSEKVVAEAKGKDRPYYQDKQRLIMLNSVYSIDHTYLCDERTAAEIIKELEPNKYFKGDDYSDRLSHPGLSAEVQVCRTVGCELRILSGIESYSTSSLIEKIQRARHV